MGDRDRSSPNTSNKEVPDPIRVQIEFSLCDTFNERFIHHRTGKHFVRPRLGNRINEGNGENSFTDSQRTSFSAVTRSGRVGFDPYLFHRMPSAETRDHLIYSSIDWFNINYLRQSVYYFQRG